MRNNERLKLTLFNKPDNYFFFSGGGVGASSILLIHPQQVHSKHPKGVVVAILVNLQRVDLQKTAVTVARCFERAQC